MALAPYSGEKIKLYDIEVRVRRKIQDDYQNNWRFQPAEVYDALRDAVTAIRGDRPESRYLGGMLVAKSELLARSTSSFCSFVVPESFPGDVGGTNTTLVEYRQFHLNMEPEYTEALVYHVLHALYQKDDPDTANAELSKMYFEKYSLIARG